MFKDLFDLQKKRQKGEVFGFYIFYVVVGALLVGLISGMIIGIFFGKSSSFQENFKLGKMIGPFVGIFYTFFLGLYVIINKNILKNFKAILLLTFSVALTYLCGCLIGFIPLSLITTIDSNVAEENSSLDS